MPWKRWTLQSKDRFLEISIGGRWYLGFTLALGVAAIYSTNNVLYLLESLLLSSLLLSGVLSEITVARVAVSRIPGNLHAESFSEDTIIVENLTSLPLYCLELGEYLGDRREYTAFLLYLPPREKVRVRSRQWVAKRGRHHWDGLVVATSFPFGFARKIRTISAPGSRIVWPKAIPPRKLRIEEEESRRGDLEVVPDEVAPVEPWQDVSRVHWPVSARVGALMARPERRIEPQEEVWLPLREPSEEMERSISEAAGALGQRSHTLVLVRKSERQRISGKQRALDALALLPQEEGA